MMEDSAIPPPILHLEVKPSKGHQTEGGATHKNHELTWNGGEGGDSGAFQ